MTLYIVATPIGNLEDITLRALAVLKQVDLILCEDTRQSSILLHHYGIRKPLESCHQYSEQAKVERVLSLLQAGQAIALISDAGTPLISDPGFSLVRAVREAGLNIVPIPGACAAISALCVAGLPTHAFYFGGFLPAKALARQQVLSGLETRTETLIFYEAPHRILDTLQDIDQCYPDRRCVLAKELSKQFEHIKLGSARQLKSWLEEDSLRQKGEFVLLIEGKTQPLVQDHLPEESIIKTQELLKVLAQSGSTKDAARVASELTGLSKNDLYEALTLLRKN